MRSSTFAVMSLLIASLVLPLMSAYGDTLVLTNGDRRKGIVEDIPGQPDNLILMDAAGRTTIPRSRVQEIIKEPRADSLIGIGNQLYEKGLLQEALKYYRDALQADAQSKSAKDLIAATEAELDRRANAERRQQMQDISQILRDARTLYENGDFQKSQDLLDQAAKMNPSETQAAEMRSVRINMLMGWGHERMDRMDRDGAAEKYQAVLALAPQHVQAMNELIALWKDDTTKTERVRQLLEARLKQNSEDPTTIKMLADIAYREKQFDKALVMYKKLYEESGAWVGTEVETRLRTCMENVRDRAASDGDIEKAITYHKQLMEFFPETDATLLDVYDYRIRVSKLAPDDEQGWLALAKWVEAKTKDDRFSGRFSAFDLYKRVLEINPENEEALLAYREHARLQLTLAKQEFEKQNYHLAKSMFDEFQTAYPMAPQVIEEAREFSEMSTIEIRNQRLRNEDAAKRMIESANYYYQQAQYNEQIVALPREQVRQLPVVANPRNEAIKYYDLAIRAFEQAIALGPNLPEVRSGEAQVKLNEARTMLRRLRQPIDFGLPAVRSR